MIQKRMDGWMDGWTVGEMERLRNGESVADIEIKIEIGTCLPSG